MTMHRTLLPRSARLGLIVAMIAAVGTGAIVWYQAKEDYKTSIEDLQRRAAVLLHRNTPAASIALQNPYPSPEVNERLEGHSRMLGMGIFNNEGVLIAGPPAVAQLTNIAAPVVAELQGSDTPVHRLVQSAEGTTHIMAVTISGPDTLPLGSLVILHDAFYIEDRLTRGMVRGLTLAVGVAIVLFGVSTLLAWLVFERPLNSLAEWMRKLRFSSEPHLPPSGIPVRRLAEESVHLAASFRAARTSERENATQILRNEKVWTRDRLRAHALSALGGDTLVVVSNREPYMHQLKEGKPVLVKPASGLVTGLDPVLQVCGGLWVAHGAGDADVVTADANGCVSVPPDDPRYTLKRVWITKEEEEGYYYGFSNEGLWPLCHLTHERPTFRASDWEQYVRANQRFADAVIEEVGNESAVIMVQDYQLALVPAMIKQRRPDLRIGLFWHIPWPNPEAFRICPYRVEILRGMLGADLIGFHLQQHCNNFLDTVDRMVEAKLDWDHFSADVRGQTTLVRPFPISVQLWSEKQNFHPPHGAEMRNKFGLGDVAIGVGVDRIDYTKGIAERFRAIDRFFELHPEQIGKFSFVQLGAPSRTHIPRYRDLQGELETLADSINWKHKSTNSGWKPIHFLVAHHDAATVYSFLRMSRVCIVSSLHDGMNLVAKEFVSAQGEPRTPEQSLETDETGVLILSEFAGAARDLTDALIVNPYDTEQFATAIGTAVDMPIAARKARLDRLYQQVAENNIYRWAGEFLSSLAQSRTTETVRPRDSTIESKGNIQMPV